MSIGVLAICIATNVVFCLVYYWERCHRKISEAAAVDMTTALDLQMKARAAERTGRIRAEKKLREQLSTPASGAAPEAAYPLAPIGHLQSCFSQRNGTPRQPLLARNARAKLVLRPDIPAGCLEGLEQYSHVWMLFIFHCNTDLQRLWSPSHATDGLKAKVQVPRLNGGRMGVLATRSPHRPAPIGLSVAEVIAVKGRTLIVGGADIVDGSPVLDVKPYLPFCDSLPSAITPSWVPDDLSEDALSITGLAVSEASEQQLHECWEAKGATMRELYPAFSDFMDLIRQVLARDDLTAPPELPSQPDIPPPELPSPALLYTHAPNGAAPPQQSPSLGGALGSFIVQYPGPLEQPLAAQRQIQEQNDHGNGDASAQRSKATRRGPMDEMRQLVRILVKIIPHSVGFLSSAEEGGGGNRISEERIKYFLDSTLGDAPRPTWGVPQGWGVYLSELFTWIMERPITKDQAMRCAKREPGRSWEAIGSELRRLGIHSSVWPLPLTREGLRKAAKDPIPQPMPSAGKRPAEETKGPASKRRGSASGGADPESMGEVEIWQHIIRLLQAARRKQGTAGAADSGAAAIGQLRAEAQALMGELCAAGSMGSLQGAFALPVVVGPNGQLQFVQHMPHFPVASAASPPQHQQQLSWPMMPSGSGPLGSSQLASPQLHDSERLYERLHVTLPEANTDMDIQWPESSQKGGKGSTAVIRPQPMKPDQASGNPNEAAGVSFQPINSSVSIVPFRHSAAPSSSLIPVSGALTGPYIPASAALIVQAKGLQAPTLDGTPARSQPTSTVPAQLSRFAPEQANSVAVSGPAIRAPSLSAALR
ncbi:hypothetical protein WJX75_007371 [Coccomyxa subellipsoidea]|uniref:TsaA-like domain-containing protein n=1 Tax=Coccomyxa subellipsoidea TaxID=248742 RepID=A0ABR2YQR1_9CHLO